MITTQQNTCLEFQTPVGCQRAKCSKYHVAIALIVDSLPCAPGDAPKALGPLPKNIKTHPILKTNAEWTTEQKTRIKASFVEFKQVQCERLQELNQDFNQRNQLAEMEAVLAAAEERLYNSQVNRDHLIRGVPQLEAVPYDRFPQLAYQPNLPSMEP